MRFFVSYARRDNSVNRLTSINDLLRTVGQPYIDDMHHSEEVARHVSVMEALYLADVFVAVRTPNYMRTPWTRLEVGLAKRRGLRLLVLGPDDKLRASSYEQLEFSANAIPGKQLRLEHAAAPR